MKIVRLTAENVKRLKVVEITPEGDLVVITGRNAQGKSSVLDAIWLALGGGPATRGTAKPIRDGETEASVRLDLGDLVVIRTWKGASTTLKVESSEGARFSSPQAMLDSLVGRLSFDPLAFTNLSPKDQLAALLDIVDLDVDLDELAAERSKLYDFRTNVGRDRDQRAGELAGLPPIPEDTPDEEVNMSSLLIEYRRAQEVWDARRKAAHALVDLRDQEQEVFDTQRSLEEELLRNKQEQERLKDAIAAGQKALVAQTQTGELQDLDEFQERLAGVEEINRAVRARHSRVDLDTMLATRQQEYANATRELATLDKAKATALANAEFPVPGLGFDESGVTYQGIPFTQASSAEQIRVSLAMAMALNPKLRVIRIEDGSLLDADNLALIAEMASANDYQVWIERVADASGLGIIIEDGEVFEL